MGIGIFNGKLPVKMAINKHLLAIVTLFAPLLLYGTGALTISGTITSAPSEQDILDGGQTIVLNLSSGATWKANIDNTANPWKSVFSSTGSWSVVSNALTTGNLVRNNDTTFTITLSPSPTYVILTDEEVTITIPDGFLDFGDSLNTVTFTVNDINPLVTFGGTARPTITESNIRTSGSFTLIFNVKYDTWHSTLDDDNSVTSSFLAGITGNQNWSIVSAELDFNDLNRDSPSKVTLTLPAVAAYAISSNETVSVNVPAGSFTGSEGVNPGSAFTVTNQQASVTATWSTGSSTITEAEVRTGGKTLTLNLTSSDSWISNTGTLATQLAIGLSGGVGSEWNTKILPNITVNRSSATQAIVTFAGDATFDIVSSQVITYAIPDAALIASSGALISTSPGSFSISPIARSASLSPVSFNEASLNGATVDVNLSEETFSNPSGLSVSNFTLSAAPAGTTITSVTNRLSSGVRLVLEYTGDIDVNGSLQVTVNSGLTGGGSIVSNTATVTAVLEPVITAVSIPNQSYKIGDVVPVTITVQNDVSVFTMTSGTVAGRTLTGFNKQNNTTYRASFTILAGTTDFPALSDIPVSLQLQVSARTGNLFTTPVSQNSDLLDANAPVVSTYQALGTVHKTGDFVQVVAGADAAGYSVNSAQTSFNGLAEASPFFNLLSEEGGSYYFSYQVSANDNDVTSSAGLSGQIVLTDAAGNSSTVKTVSAVSTSFRIDAHAPVILTITAPDSAYISGETLILSVTSDGTGYSLSPETFINGISSSSGRFTLNGAGPVYTLNYPIQAGDAEVSAGNLPVNIVLKDLVGNKSTALTSFSNNVVIYTSKPTAIISGTTSLCKGDSARIFVSLTGRKNWNIIVTNGVVSFPFNEIATSPFSFKFAPNVNTSYSVQSVSDKTGLTNTGTGLANFTVNVGTPVKINTMAGTYSISGDPVPLSAIPPGGIFSGPGVVSSVNKFYPDIAGVDNSPHKLMYSYINNFGCLSRDSVNVAVVKATGIIITDKDLYCYNDLPFIAQAVTESTGSFELRINEILVSDGSGIHDNGNKTATITPSLLSPGDYMLTYIYLLDTLKLSIEKGFSIEFVEQPRFTLQDKTICEDVEPIELVGDARKPKFSGYGVTENNPGDFRFDPSITSFGKYLVTYSDTTVNGCKNESSQEITVFYVPPMGFTASDSCVVSANPGTEIFFTNTTANKDSISKWYWIFDDVNSGAKNFSELESPSHFFNTSGKYSIILIDTSANGCIGRHEMTLDFGDKPSGSFDAVNKCFTPGQETQLISETSSKDAISIYSWKIQIPDGINIDTSLTTAIFNYQFESDGKYLIEHIVTTNTKCTLTLLDSIFLKPTIVVKTGIPNTENFSESENGWNSSKFNNISTGLSWKWGKPDFTNLIGDNENAWFTNRTNTSIPELSYLISSCYNLRELVRPMVKMDIFRNLENSPDAVILQTSTNNGIDWNTLGNPGDGINWYSDYQTTNYAFGSNYGWATPIGSNADSGWVESRHILDPVAGSVNLQFRLVFGAKESSVADYEGFAIRNITIGERNRFSVLEHFTNTTPNNPVKNKAKNATAKVHELYSKGELYKDFIKLEYHTRFPSANDSLNIFNRDVPGARAYYYGITTIPYSILDGGDRTDRRFDFSDTKYEPKEVDINLRSLVDPPAAINVEAAIAVDEINVNVQVKALRNLPAAERVLYVVLYETIVTGYKAESQDSVFRNVVRYILPDAGGTDIYQAFSASPTDTTILEFNYTANIGKLNEENVRVAAYLQDDFTGEIHQAGLSDYSRYIGVGVNPEISYSNSISVYPNPATDFVELNISGLVVKSSMVEFFDQLGRKIYSQEILPQENRKVINTSDFDKGIYYLRMTSKGIQRSEIRKLVIMK